MASPSTTARSRSTQGLSSDDVIAMRAAELAAWAQKNARTILIGAVTAVAAALVILGIRYSNQKTAERAAAEWMQVQSAVEQGPAGLQRLNSFAGSFGGTPEAAEARLAMADIYLDQNRAQDAIREARRVVDAGGVWTYKGLMMLGAAQAKAGQRQPAIETYLRAAEETRLTFERQEARSEAALLHEEAGNWTQAAEVYRSMLADAEEGTLDRSILELRVAESEMRATGTRR